MTGILFDGKATSIAKKLKLLCNFNTLKASKSALAELTGYTDWVQLSKCDSKVIDKELKCIEYDDVSSISRGLQKYTQLDSSELRSWVAINFAFKPSNINQLNVFITDGYIAELNSTLNSSKKIHELINQKSSEDISENDLQGMVHLIFTMSIIPSKEIHPFEKLAIISFISSELNGASAQVEFGRALIEGTYGFKDLEFGVEMLDKGLPFFSELRFKENTIVINCEKEVSKLRVVSDWLLCSTAMFKSNRFDSPHYFTRIHNALEMALHWLDLVDCTTDELKLEAKHLKAKSHYQLAQLAAMAIAEENLDYLKKTNHKILFHLDISSQLGNETALKIHQYYQSAVLVLDEGQTDILPVNTKAEVIMQVAWKLCWFYHPVARLMISEPIINNAIDQTQYYLDNPASIDTVIDIINLTKESIEKWPHLKKPLLSITDTILLQLYKNELSVEKAVEVGISLFYWGDDQMIYNTVIAMKLNFGNQKFVEFFEKHDCMNVLKSVVGHSLDIQFYDEAISLYTRCLIDRRENLSSVDIEHIKKLCDSLLDKNFVFPAFKLVFKLRESEKSLEYDWLLPWVNNIVTKMTEQSFIPHPKDVQNTYVRIVTELGLLNMMNDEPWNAKKHWEMIAHKYPFAQEMLLHFGL